MFDSCISIVPVIGYWVAGFLVGYGVRGLFLCRATDRIIKETLRELRERAAKQEIDWTTVE